uniref:Uncharacterized protein n=1 Tax=Knipowitschia caucasica TaxID=637954 RepID=A0AAV2LR39_KNICA
MGWREDVVPWFLLSGRRGIWSQRRSPHPFGSGVHTQSGMESLWRRQELQSRPVVMNEFHNPNQKIGYKRNAKHRERSANQAHTSQPNGRAARNEPHTHAGEKSHNDTSHKTEQTPNTAQSGSKEHQSTTSNQPPKPPNKNGHTGTHITRPTDRNPNHHRRHKKTGNRARQGRTHNGSKRPTNRGKRTDDTRKATPKGQDSDATQHGACNKSKTRRTAHKHQQETRPQNPQALGTTDGNPPGDTHATRETSAPPPVRITDDEENHTAGKREPNGNDTHRARQRASPAKGHKPRDHHKRKRPQNRQPRRPRNHTNQKRHENEGQPPASPRTPRPPHGPTRHKARNKRHANHQEQANDQAEKTRTDGQRKAKKESTDKEQKDATRHAEQKRHQTDAPEKERQTPQETKDKAEKAEKPGKGKKKTKTHP